MKALSSSTFKRVATGLLVVAVILAVSALGIHALIHGQDDASGGGQCQICHLSHVSAPVPAAATCLQASVTLSRYSPPTVPFSHVATIFEHSSPRAPPV
jgi:hypothetical protein